MAFPATAQAHANLLRTDPAAGSVVATAPSRIVLHFDQQVHDVASTVTNDRGEPVTSAAASTAPGDVRALVIPLKPNLPNGDYTVRWRIVSTDGHIISGVFAVGVGAGRPPPQAAEVQTATLDWPFLAGRFAYFCGLMLVIGGVVFRAGVWRPVLGTIEGQPRAMADLRERIRATQLFTAAAVLMLAGGWVALTRQGAEVAGVSFWEAFDHRGPVASAIQATRFGREFGRGIDLAAIFCVCAAGAFAMMRRSRLGAAALAIPAVVLGIWTIVVPGYSGHAGDPGRGAFTIAVDTVHVAASAVWIGGLAQLVLVLPHATRGLADAARDRARRAALRRFSTVALASVCVVAVTGAGRALWEVGAVSQVWSTGYGRTLVAKTLLLGGLVALGYRNRSALDRFAEVRRRAVAELVLLAGVLAAVALLTDLQPANTPGFANPAPAVPAGGPVLVGLSKTARLALWPGVAGPNVIAVTARGRPRPTQALVGGRTIALRPAPDGTYVGSGTLAAGTHSILVTAGARTWAASAQIGPVRRAPQPAAAPLPTGPVAAGQASDVAVGLQRTSATSARVTLLGQSGSSIPGALVLVGGRVALPCPRVRGVCFETRIPRGPRPVDVQVRRPGLAAVTATVQLPRAGAPDGTALLHKATANFRALHSLRVLNVLESRPGHAVTTDFVVQAPDRLAFTVRGGASARIIGTTRYDRQPGHDWIRSETPRSKVPDAFWAPGAEAVYVAGGDRSTTQLTLVLPGGPTFFRLWVDRSSRQVVRLRMITAAHFMREREYDQNRAPPVEPPA
ncbi:MAG TPA: copper resistance protein CopC [Gaiellales bacterium]